MDELIGKTIDNYRIESVLGKGGMGIVYRAYDIKLERFVAIKLLNSHLFQREESIDRFKREAKNQAKLTHPNIVGVYGFIEYSNFLGIVMEYVEGDSLEQIIDRMKSLHSWDAVYLLKQILTAIGYAHSKGFVHRDIKPSNIIINGEGVVKIMDFGISKSLFEKGTTKPGSKVGTIFYMSPEQIRTDNVTHHADIYSIGCTLYEMLIGLPPFFAESDFDVMEMHLKQKPPSISAQMPLLTPQIDDIINRAMAKQPTERYSSCEEFLLDVVNLEKQIKEKHSDRIFGRKKQAMKKSTTYVIMLAALIGFSGLVYLAYTQVFALLQSKQLDSLQKYSISRLFKADSSFYTFEHIVKQNSNTRLNLNSIYFLPNKTGIIAGDSGLFLYTRDGGNNWLRGNTASRSTFFDCTIINSGQVFLVGDSSTVLIANSDLSEFKQIPIEQGYSFYKIYFINGNTGFIAGSRGAIYKTTNGGTLWRRVNSATSAVLYDIYFMDENNGFASGWNGTIISTTDGGENWKPIENGEQSYLKSIHFLDKSVGLSAGGNGTLLKSEDGGQNWVRMELKKQVIFNKVKFIKEDLALLAGKKGTILISKDQGETWEPIKVNFFYDLTNFYVTNNNELYIVGVSGTIYKILLIEKES